MKMFKLLPLLIWLAAIVAGLGPRTARAEVSFQFFYDSLAPYGEWLQVGDYGYCWRPNDVDADWSPYSDGYWAYTDAGWTWVSYEDWGGITYHYGRWVDVRDEGWCWVPDYDWGPAWVSWRNSDDYIGWAPLPPEAHWQPDVGFGIWVDNTCDIGPGYYNFCHSYDFGAGFLRPCLIPRVQNVAIIQKTVNITNITFNNVNRVPFNGGPNFRLANEHSRRPIPALKLVQRRDFENVGLVKEAGRQGGRARAPLLRSAQRGNQLEVFAPNITKPEDPAALKPGKIAKVVDKEKVNKGWAVVKDPEERKQLKQKMQQQTANLTPTTAPAKPVQGSDLAVIPEKADPNAPSPAALARAKGKGKDDAALAGEGRGGKNQGRTDGISQPESVSGNVATDAGTKAKANEKNAALDRRDAVDSQAAKARQAERAMEQQRENALTDQERADRRARRQDAEGQQKAESQRDAGNVGGGDEVDRAVARARRQQEINAAQENAQRANQRAAAVQARREQQAAQAGVDRRQEQIELQREQAVRERQLDMQRQTQVERAQEMQQQRALQNQRAAQQQRQAEAQRQFQIQRQQPQAPPPAQARGSGGGGGGGKHQATEEGGQDKKQRGF